MFLPTLLPFLILLAFAYSPTSQLQLSLSSLHLQRSSTTCFVVLTILKTHLSSPHSHHINHIMRIRYTPVPSSSGFPPHTPWIDHEYPYIISNLYQTINRTKRVTIHLSIHPSIYLSIYLSTQYSIASSPTKLPSYQLTKKDMHKCLHTHIHTYIRTLP
ncbi:hypothetical protein P168DRAFT_122853 [Aspergillus campestris IBT 28561]|uniref:Uncharacterized protein n=1 Tax=Aspergillus campestris (strain IBT 28561) TaxID=1392248 RepID=A0A2I1D696_ASPC2|nr:uncharacterized protein P168DRAFT_122853 [Aspergillus campestris IBT 28561]PKY05401.1 hypothetical protein P168DRAFT_122853 [Aspergillus campestris IBT 28561]